MSENNCQEKFKNKYRVESASLPDYDYSQNGYYFVTICTVNRERFFGEIKNDQMELSKMGEIAHNCWAEIPKHFPFVELESWIIMPNHVHGIISIDKNIVEMLHATSQTEQRQQHYHGENKKLSEISPQKYSLSSIIRSYKSSVTKNVRELNPDFAWQPKFHEHIIRNEQSYYTISDYIIDNAARW